MARKNYGDYIYIKDGVLMIEVKETVLEKGENDELIEIKKLVFREYNTVSKNDIFAAIEDFLKKNPEQLSISSIIFSSIQTLTGFQKCMHFKQTPSTSNNRQLNDPLYDELENFTRNSEIYKKSYEIQQNKRKKLKQGKLDSRNQRYVAKQLDSFFIDACRRKH